MRIECPECPAAYDVVQQACVIVDAGTGTVRRLVRNVKVETLRLQRALKTPHGVCVAPDGAIVVAEMEAHRAIAIDLSGKIESVFGTGVAGSAPHQLRRPAAVLVHSGLLWVADLENHQIKATPYP